MFYKKTPKETLKFKGEKYTNGKLSKVKITVFVYVQIWTAQNSENKLSWVKEKKAEVFNECLKYTHQLQIQSKIPNEFQFFLKTPTMGELFV